MKKTLFFLAFSMCPFLLSQTPYLEKVNKLKDDFFITMGANVDSKNLWKENYFNDLPSFMRMLYSNGRQINTQKFIINLKSEQGQQKLTKFLKELNSYNSLYTEEDAMFYKQILNDKWKDKAINSSQLFFINKVISEDISNYLKKNEYEKTIDYEIRMKKENIIDFFKKSVSKNIQEYTHGKEISIKEYDADKELYYTSISSSPGGTRNGKSNADYVFQVPLDQAKEFKKKTELSSVYRIVPAVSSKIVITELGGVMFDKLFINIGNKEYFGEINEASQNLSINLNQFIKDIDYVYNFSEEESIKNNALKNFVGIWKIGNVLINLKPNNSAEILNYGKNEHNKEGLFPVFQGKWNYEDNVLKLKGNDINDDEKKYNMYITSMSDKAIMFSYSNDKSNIKTLNYIEEKNLQEIVKQIKKKQEEESKNEELLNAGKSLLKSLLK